MFVPPPPRTRYDNQGEYAPCSQEDHKRVVAGTAAPLFRSDYDKWKYRNKNKDQPTLFRARPKTECAGDYRKQPKLTLWYDLCQEQQANNAEQNDNYRSYQLCIGSGSSHGRSAIPNCSSCANMENNIPFGALDCDWPLWVVSGPSERYHTNGRY